MDMPYASALRIGCLEALKSLVVVDSIAFHLRHADVTYMRRQQLAGSMAQALT